MELRMSFNLTISWPHLFASSIIAWKIMLMWLCTVKTIKDEELEETCFCTTYYNSVCTTLLKFPTHCNNQKWYQAMMLGVCLTWALEHSKYTIIICQKKGVDQRENHSLTSKRFVNGCANLSNTNLISVHSSWDLNSWRYLK